jgi:hypothetical protein
MFTGVGLRLQGRATGRAGLNNKAAFAMGLVGLGVGMLPFLALMGVLPTAPRSPDAAPDWLGILFGLAFLFAGLIAIIRSFAGMDAEGNLSTTAPGAVRVINDGLGVVIAASLAVIFTWVAFGPGERHFTMSGGFAGASGAMESGDMPGRIAFGFGAVLGWILVALYLRYIARRWSARRHPQRVSKLV